MRRLFDAVLLALLMSGIGWVPYRMALRGDDAASCGVGGEFRLDGFCTDGGAVLLGEVGSLGFVIIDAVR